jgi:tRNA threonylcarbamoyl adenosine modification protein (Sua5/YciO/YrdC/YwlC family)
MRIELFPDNIDDRKIEQAVKILRAGGVVIYPTDTVYTLGCSLSSNKGLERVARLKNIKIEKAKFSIVCSDLSHMTDFSMPVSNPVFKLMKTLLPGPYTFILEGNRNIPRLFESNRKSIGIRVPNHPIATRLVQALGEPLVSTSIHDEDELLEYSTDAERIDEKWGDKVDMVIDGGPGGFLASTIIDCTKGGIEIIREGKGLEEASALIA